MKALIFLLFLSTSIFAQKKTPKGETEIISPSRPLVVVDGKVVYYTSLKDCCKGIKDDDIESMSVLKYPLYIINGVAYKEMELFGPRPTSPYYPLVDQEIVSIEIIRKKQTAVELHGNSEVNRSLEANGRLEVHDAHIIIVTKDGKPLEKKEI
ncbi:hypothetical protein ACI6PS_06125 [Flavobacterium sp. PLA-1-15]|uniref:hypothetical protein n=1 Tax=Flavobacterium sp. PLA-1-15 TaxID=3380533 RepID=UPI003B76BB4E